MRTYLLKERVLLSEIIKKKIFEGVIIGDEEQRRRIFALGATNGHHNHSGYPSDFLHIFARINIIHLN